MDSSFGYFSIFARRSTPIERLVIVWLLIIVTAAAGCFCLYMAYNAAPGKAAQAAQLRLYGCAFLGLALFVWLAHRVIGWVLDR